MSGAAPISWLVYMAIELWRPFCSTATFGSAWVAVTDSRRFLSGEGGKREKRLACGPWAWGCPIIRCVWVWR